MLNPKEISEADQAFKAFVDNFAPMWASLYKALIAEGMPPNDAVKIVQAHVYAIGSRV